MAGNKKTFKKKMARIWTAQTKCDHSQGVYLPPNTGGEVLFFGFIPTNKQTENESEDARN